MKKRISFAVGVIVALLVVSTAGYSWNYATHAYIATKIGTFLPLLRTNEIYGLMAPDIFNLDFSLMNDIVLRGYTHGIPAEDPGGPNQDFMAVWKKADGPFQKAVAYGYVAHNDAWGADYIAHWKAIPPPRPFTGIYAGQPPGYIIALAVELDKILDAQGIWDQIAWLLGGQQLPVEDRINFTHNIVEFSGDILIRRADPQIGKKIFEAALLRTPEFPGLLKTAFPVQYANMIDTAEEAFRQELMQYGGLLWSAPSEGFILDAVSDQLATFAVQYLSIKFGQDFSSYQPYLVPIAKGAMIAGVQICEDAHYMSEVNATALYVAIQLLLHRVSFFFFW
jgi:hypothetical protein